MLRLHMLRSTEISDATPMDGFENEITNDLISVYEKLQNKYKNLLAFPRNLKKITRNDVRYNSQTEYIRKYYEL